MNRVFAGAPPGTRTPNPRIKSPLLKNSTPAFYQHLYASLLARYPQPAEAECRLRTADTEWYRDIRANTEQTTNPVGLDQCEGDHPCRREERSQRSGMLVQKRLQRWTRSVISPGSVTRQEGARWTSRIRAVCLGRTCRSATPAVGPPGPQVPVLPICRCPAVAGSAMTLQVRRHDKVSEPDTRMGSRSPNQAVPPIGARDRAAASMSPLVRSSRSAWVIPLRRRQRLAS